MRASEAKNLFRALTKVYFVGATVAFSNQSRTAKPTLPLVNISTGNVRRTSTPVCEMIGGTLVGNYPSRISITVDLFTHGLAVTDDVTGQVVAYENSAMDDMLGFADFLSSEYAIKWSHQNDVSIQIEGDVMDMTGIVNDSTYEYRARISVMFYFTQKTVGTAGVLSESSIKYPTGETDPQTGLPVYTEEEPLETTSTTGDQIPDEAKEKIEQAVIQPVYEQTSTGGGSEGLANEVTGYFTEVEIKEEKANE